MSKSLEDYVNEASQTVTDGLDKVSQSISGTKSDGAKSGSCGCDDSLLMTKGKVDPVKVAVGGFAGLGLFAAARKLWTMVF